MLTDDISDSLTRHLDCVLDILVARRVKLIHMVESPIHKFIPTAMSILIVDLEELIFALLCTRHTNIYIDMVGLRYILDHVVQGRDWDAMTIFLSVLF